MFVPVVFCLKKVSETLSHKTSQALPYIFTSHEKFKKQKKKLFLFFEKLDYLTITYISMCSLNQ